MAVLLYQIGIFIAIQIAAMFGRNSRNTAVVLISIFTILQVFISWLLLLQFVTIIISYNISNNLFSSKTNTNKKVRKENEYLSHVSYRTENGGRGLMARSDFEELKRKEQEQYKIYCEENKDKIEEFNQKSDKEKAEGYIKILREMTGE